MKFRGGRTQEELDREMRGGFDQNKMYSCVKERTYLGVFKRDIVHTWHTVSNSLLGMI